jgi:hypothetical protein
LKWVLKSYLLKKWFWLNQKQVLNLFKFTAVYFNRKPIVIFLDENVTASYYQEFLNEFFDGKNFEEDDIWMQDGAPAHKAMSIVDSMEITEVNSAILNIYKQINACHQQNGDIFKHTF